MKTLNKQFALKAALLVALGANVSGSYFDVPGTFNTTDLAAQGEVVAGSGGRTGAPAATVIIKPVETKPDAARAGNDGVRADKPAKVEIATNVVPVTTKSLETKVCERDYKIVYREIQKDGKPVTQSVIHNKDNKAIYQVDRPGTLVANVDDTKVRASIDLKLQKAVQKSLNDCMTVSEVAASNSTTTTASNETVASDNAEDRKKEKVLEGVTKCTMDTKGKSLDARGRFDCLLGRLNKVEAKDDDRSNSRALAQIDSIADDLRRAIKDIMLGKGDKKRKTREERKRDREDGDIINEDQIEEGMELAIEAADAIEEAGDDLDLTDREDKRLKAIANKVRALREGGKVELATSRYREEARMNREDYMAARESFDSAQDPWSQAMFANQMNSIIQKQGALSHYMNQTFIAGADGRPGLYTQLQNMQSQRLIDPVDFKDLTANYSILRREANWVQGGGGNTITARDRNGRPMVDFEVPADLKSVRQSYANNFQSNYPGLAIPNRAPDMSHLGNFGSSAAALRPPAPLFNGVSSGRRP